MKIVEYNATAAAMKYNGGQLTSISVQLMYWLNWPYLVYVKHSINDI